MKDFKLAGVQIAPYTHDLLDLPGLAQQIPALLFADFSYAGELAMVVNCNGCIASAAGPATRLRGKVDGS